MGQLQEGRRARLPKSRARATSHGVVSEVSAYMTVKPGHEEEARAAALRFGEMLLKSDPKDVQRTGLRDARLVNFDDGRRLLFASGFETDWDPYVDDAILSRWHRTLPGLDAAYRRGRRTCGIGEVAWGQELRQKRPRLSRRK